MESERKYNHREIDRAWQARWTKDETFRTPTEPKSDKKRYVLDMFPYPSGAGLHVGHPEGYIASDILARYYRAKGYDVLHPMGWDAFGLPAENYALQTGTHPRITTEQNINHFREQLQRIGFSYDWDREVNTTDPKYYKWTQWIFLQLFKAGLAYEAEAPINWCPKDKVGLANEEVVNGRCERCGTPVERRMLRQWFLRITKYAEKLLEGLEKLDWPEHIKTLQRNWIGKSEGAEVTFTAENGKPITVFTTRPDTLFGATYLVLAPEHALVSELTTQKQNAAVEKYVTASTNKSDLERTALEKEKTGVFTGAFAENPVNGERIPIWVADYVLSTYGTGAIMAVPAHDTRDFEFATKFKLPIIKVIRPPKVMSGGRTEPIGTSAGAWGHLGGDLESDCWIGEGTLMNSGGFDDLPSEEARKRIVDWLGEQEKAKPKVQYKLRDWVFSRQRYWGEPIPVVHCEHCRTTVEATPHHFKTDSEKLWAGLLEQESTIDAEKLGISTKPSTNHNESDGYIRGTFRPTQATEYFRIKKVSGTTMTIKRVFPGIILVPESELPVLLPEVKKYEPTGNGESPLANVKDWVNVTCRVCGHSAKRETNTMPQWAGSSWYFYRFTDPKNDKAFASEKALEAWMPVDFYIGGAEHAVLHLLYARFWHKALFDLKKLPEAIGDEPFMKLRNQGIILGEDGEKMSKSRGNVVTPDEILDEYGADAFRCFEMFMGPIDMVKPWNTRGIIGVHRFLDRVWTLTLSNSQGSNSAMKRTDASHRLVATVSKGIEGLQLNTCISDLMKFTNLWKTAGSLPKEDVEIFLQLLAPFAPHVAEELWKHLGHENSVSLQLWPGYQASKLVDKSVQLVVQVSGKRRATLDVLTGTSQQEIEGLAKAEPNVSKYLNGEIKKIVFVKDRLINFVV